MLNLGHKIFDNQKSGLNKIDRSHLTMTINEQIQRSVSLHRTAAQLLSSTRLLEILGKYGEVRLVGSYAANLMMHGDIDVHVIKPHGYTMPDILKVFSEIALTDNFEQQMIWNWDKKTRKPEWKPVTDLGGFYIFLRTRYGEIKWKIDIWFIDSAEQTKADSKLNVMNMTITDEQRKAILAFKKIRNEAGIEYGSQKIYELVLVRGMTSRLRFKLLLIKERCKQWLDNN